MGRGKTLVSQLAFNDKNMYQKHFHISKMKMSSNLVETSTFAANAQNFHLSINVLYTSYD